MRTKRKQGLLTAVAAFALLLFLQLAMGSVAVKAADGDVKVTYGSSTSARHYINEQSGTTSDTLKFTLASSLGTVKSQKWSSSNTAVAKVTSATGKTTKLTMGSEGTAVITLTVTSSKSKTYTEKIFVSSWVDVEDATVTANASPTYFFRGPIDGTYEVASNKGSVPKGKSIKITRRCGSFYYLETRDASINFLDNTNKGFVKAADLKILVNNLKTTAGPLELEVDEAATLSKIISPSYASNTGVKWSSSNTSVAVVNYNGLVTARKIGTATITLALSDGSLKTTCVINVVSKNNGTYNLTTELVDSKTIKLKWTGLVAMDNYSIYRSTSQNGEYKCIGGVNHNSTNQYEFIDNTSGLKLGTTYYYKVLFNNAKASVFSKVSNTLLRHTIGEYSFSFCNAGDYADLSYDVYEYFSPNNIMLSRTSLYDAKQSITYYDEKQNKYVKAIPKWKGSCYGIVTLANMLSTNKQTFSNDYPSTETDRIDFSISDFNNQAKKISDLKITDKNDFNLSLKDVIEVLQLRQAGSHPITTNPHGGRVIDKSAYDMFCEMNIKDEPIQMAFFWSMYNKETKQDEIVGHAILAYAYEKISNTKERIYVYDPNYPNTERYINITIGDTGITEFEYDGHSSKDTWFNYYKKYEPISTYEETMLSEFYDLKNACLGENHWSAVKDGRVFTLSYSTAVEDTTVEYYPKDATFSFYYDESSAFSNARHVSYTIKLTSLQYINFQARQIDKYSVNGRFSYGGLFADKYITVWNDWDDIAHKNDSTYEEMAYKDLICLVHKQSTFFDKHLNCDENMLKYDIGDFGHYGADYFMPNWRYIY